MSFGCTPKNETPIEKLSTDAGFLKEKSTEEGKNYITITTDEVSLRLEVVEKNIYDNLNVNDYYLVAFNQDNIVKSVEVKPFLKLAVDKFLNNDIEINVINPTDKVDTSKLTLLDSMIVDFDGDGVEETVELYTAAERYNGEIAWDDGQNWMLVVKDTDKDYVLFHDYVQLGAIGFYGYFVDEDFYITTMQSGTASLTLREYKFDKNEESFVSKVKFDAEGNVNMFHHLPLKY